MRSRFQDQLRRLIIREMYDTRLMRLYEQEGGEEVTAAPAAEETPPADAAATTPTTDPTADAAPASAMPSDPAVPEPSAIPTAPAATPALSDPAASMSTPTVPTVPTGTPAAAPAEKEKKPLPPPDPEKEPMKAQVNKAFMKAQAAAAPTANESLRRRSLRFLVEAEDAPKIDVGVYAGEIAKLIKNYTSLVDIKKNVIVQAEQYLDDEFPNDSDQLKQQLKDLLRTEYHISLERSEPPADSYAIGAGASSGGAA